MLPRTKMHLFALTAFYLHPKGKSTFTGDEHYLTCPTACNVRQEREIKKSSCQACLLGLLCSPVKQEQLSPRAPSPASAKKKKRKNAHNSYSTTIACWWGSTHGQADTQQDNDCLSSLEVVVGGACPAFIVCRDLGERAELLHPPTPHSTF